MSPPLVTSYLSYRDFLRDWLAWRRQQDARYSLLSFARDGGCSRAALANVLAGTRHPQPSTLDAFARAMALGPRDRNYLGLLVDLARARALEDRRRLIQRLLDVEQFGLQRVAERDREEDVFRYLEHWYTPVIRELVGLEGFREDPIWIGSVLRPQISAEQAALAVRTLLDLGLVRRGGGGRLAPSELRFRTSPETWQAAAAHVHRVVVPELLGQIDPKRGPEQHLLAVTLAFSPDLLPEVKARLNALIEQVATMADADRSSDRRVYQLALQLLPLTGPLTE